MMRLWARLFRWRAAKCEQAATFIMPREWNDSPSAMVDLLERHAVRDRRARVVIAGYSWGAGYGAIRLAKALRKRGRTVDLMLLIDPVYRSRLPLVFRMLAFTTWFRIRIPANVRAVASWRQDHFGPRGTRITLDDPTRTEVLVHDDLSTLRLSHGDMQYHEPVLSSCFTLATGVLSHAAQRAA